MARTSDLDRAPEILGPHGILPSQESKATIEQFLQRVGQTEILRSHLAFMESISGTPLVAGNRVTLLVDNRDTASAMLETIRGARDHINLETFMFNDDEGGRTFADLLLQKQSEGVQAQLIYDSSGCWDTPAAFYQRLRNGGVEALEFNPINPLRVRDEWSLTERDHRKILVVDGRIAFTGGVNIGSFSSKSLPGGPHDEKGGTPWRDTEAMVQGPAVAGFQRIFMETWARQKGPELPRRDYFPLLEPEGNDLVRVIASTPGESNRLNYMMYVSAVTHARRFVHLTQAYFVPDEEMVKALCEAAARGVDVKIIIPSHTDSWMVDYAAQSYFTSLLKSGVKLYIGRGAVVHAKTAVVDGVWSTVGSTNFDLWSFLRSDEVNAEILSPEFAEEMEGLFMQELAQSEELLLEAWESRPMGDRIKEWLMRLFGYWL
jgi:cardiolipin synthase